jgi:hypothetical protein
MAPPKKLDEPVLAPWDVSEDPLDLLALHGTDPDRTTIFRPLTNFHESAAASDLPEMERPANTVSTCAITHRTCGHLATHTSGRYAQPRYLRLQMTIMLEKP